eukprot:gnl/TRDRNA2_/TRDRNA2_39185_c0_seq1.p1 gnl/TRDRNA2_/TRDRNA2_39185_c0~~gnl/TRDRNA2_/TRDRNA2_39185_c0_seq1.p1  ORF type:complete len:317 (+),score=41.56 gnl/TRDRNA2_/TRDRNA2_39185_c0_seq1:94-1044(+)
MNSPINFDVRTLLILIVLASDVLALPGRHALSAKPLSVDSEPYVLRLAQMRAKHIDTSAMDKLRLMNRSGKELHIFGYADEQDNEVSKQLRKSSQWEFDLVSQICDEFMAAGKGNFLDVGANIGVFSLSMSTCLERTVGSHGEVFAVEGMPDTASRLMAGFVANNMANAAVIPYAASNMISGDHAYMKRDATNKGACTVERAENADPQHDLVAINVTTLDSILSKEQGMRNLLAMKMDIEGSEGRALEGARELLAAYPPCFMVIEVNPARVDVEHIGSLLRRAGYDLSQTCWRCQAYNVPHFLKQADFDSCIARLH